LYKTPQPFVSVYILGGDMRGVKLTPPCTMVKVNDLVDKLSLFTAEEVLGARGTCGNHYLPQISWALSTPSL
jgi:hypothetical protein